MENTIGILIILISGLSVMLITSIAWTFGWKRKHDEAIKAWNTESESKDEHLGPLRYARQRVRMVSRLDGSPCVWRSDRSSRSRALHHAHLARRFTSDTNRPRWKQLQVCKRCSICRS